MFCSIVGKSRNDRGLEQHFIELYRLISQLLDRYKEKSSWLIGGLLLAVGIVLSFGLGSTGWGFPRESILESPIFWEIRLPRTAQAVLSGAGLAIAGWLMQALFRNPLASPSILGVTNGASLGVAWVTMFMASWGSSLSGVSQIMAGAVGSLSVLLLLGLFKKWIQSVTGLLIFGVMLGHFAGALETIFQLWTERENLSGLIYWSMGSFDKADAWGIFYIALVLISVVVSVKMRSRSLDAWVMGDDFARSVGISTSAFSFWLILLSGSLTAVITTYCGPIAFIGLASPHLAKFWIKKRDHRSLIIGVMLTGGLIGLYCDILTRCWHLPLNAVTSIVGAPWVMWWIIKKGRNGF